jgi:hypothetical protein
MLLATGLSRIRLELCGLSGSLTAARSLVKIVLLHQRQHLMRRGCCAGHAAADISPEDQPATALKLPMTRRTVIHIDNSIAWHGAFLLIGSPLFK